MRYACVHPTASSEKIYKNSTNKFKLFYLLLANIEARIKNKVIFKIYISGAAVKCTYFGLKAELWWPKLLRIGGSFPKRRPPRTIIFKTIMIFFCNLVVCCGI